MTTSATTSSVTTSTHKNRARRIALFIAAAMAIPALAPTSHNFATAQTAAVEISRELRSAVNDYWHFAKIGRYDAALAKGQAVLDAGEDPLVVLAAFEAIAKAGNDDLDQWMLRFRNVPAITEVSNNLAKVLADGRFARRSDPEFITANIDRLIRNEIGYRNGLENLRSSGEFAVPILLDYLRTPSKSQYHDAVRRAIRDIGKPALNPLVASTEMNDAEALAAVVGLLGDLGYPDAAPYILRVHARAGDTLRDACTRALAKLGVPATSVDAAYLDLAERFYYDRASIVADNRNDNAYIWYWNETSGLVKRDVAQNLYGRIMAMRAAEFSLEANSASGSTPDAAVADRALALWLAANYQREADANGTDASRAENQPEAHYYGVTSGSKYLSMALDRALNDRNSRLAFDVLKSMQLAVGRTNLDVTGEKAPIIQALSYGDRAVRFEAAIALASARPAATYAGADSVVPLLGEAVSQTGQPTAVLVMPATADINANAPALNAAGYQTIGVTSAGDIAAQLAEVPAVDVVVLSTQLSPEQVDAALNASRNSLKLRGAVKVLLVDSTVSPFEQLKQSDPLIHTAVVANPQQLAEAVTTAAASSASLPIDADAATAYALRSAGVLRELAVAGGIYSLDPIKSTLIGSLTDSRDDVVAAVAGVLAEYNNADAQKALLARASDTELSAELRSSLYKALAANAKNFGNKLDPAELATLEKAVTDEAELPVRSAAAEARGGLNLPADAAKSIIVGQSVR
jgi:hypothetical protein